MDGGEKLHLICFILFAVTAVGVRALGGPAVTMYNGGVTVIGAGPPTVPGAAVDPTTDANTGDDLLFTCVGTEFADTSVVTVEWTLPGSGRSPLNSNEVVDDDDAVFRDVYSTLNSYSYLASDCGTTLTCTFTQGPTVVTGTTVLSVLASVSNVELELTVTSPTTEPAALTAVSSTKLTTDTNVDASTLHVVHKKTYVFGAIAKQANTVKFDWERRDSDSTPGAALRTGSAAVTTDCTTPGTDPLTLTNIQYDMYDGKYVHVAASNSHPSSTPASTQYVKLEVEAEVDPTNIELWVSEDPLTMGTEVTTESSYALIHADTYYVHCVVKEAVPVPKIMADLGGSLGSGTSSATAFPDVGEGVGITLDQIMTTEYFTISADYGDHCGQKLKCDAYNNADTLLGEGNANDNVKEGPTISITGGSRYSSVSLTLLYPDSDEASIDGNPSTALTADQSVGGDTLIVLAGMGYKFEAETDETDPGVKFDWFLERDTGDETLKTGTLPEQVITCTQAKESDDYRIYPISYDAHDGHKITVKVNNDESTEIAQSVTLDVQAEVDPDNMEIWVSEDMNTMGTEVTNTATFDADVGTTYYVHCVVKEAVPVPTIMAALGGNLATSTSTAFADVGEGDGIGLAQIQTTEHFSFTPDYSTHCNQKITCDANNNADTLLDDAASGDNNKVGPAVLVKGDALESLDFQLLESGSYAAALSNAATTDLDKDTAVDSSKILVLLHNNDYAFLATTDSIDPVDATFAWELQDGAGDTIETLQTNGGSSTVTCSAAADSDPYTLSATYEDHHEKRIYVGVTHDYMGAESDYVTLDVRNPVINGNFLVYVSGSTVQTTASVAIDTTYDVDCVVHQAIPAPTITAELGGTALTGGTPSPDFTDVTSGAINTRVSAMRFTVTPTASDHCKELKCIASNDANTLVTSYDGSGEAERVVTLALSGNSISPTSVTLSLLESGSDHAAADPDVDQTVDLTTDTEFSDGSTAIVINGMAYTFQAVTQNTVPDAEIDWYIDDVIEENNPAPVADDASCGVDESDTYILTANYDTQDDKVLKTTAATDGNSVESTAVLDVQAEVKSAKMSFYLSSSSSNRGAEVQTSISLVDGTTYYVECQVDESSPEPSIDVKLDGDSLTESGSSDVADDVTSTSLSSLVKVKRYSFDADYNDHCNKILLCEAKNNANDLLNDFDDRESPVTTCSTCEVDSIEVKPGTPVVTVDSDEDGMDDGSVTMIDGDAYVFTCTPAGIADPEADLTWTLRDKDDTLIGTTDVMTSGQTDSDCSLAATLVSHTFTLTASKAAHCGGSLECKATSDIDSTGQTVTKTLLIYSVPSIVSLDFVASDSDKAAVVGSPTTAIGDMNIKTITLIVIHGLTYIVESAAAGDPPPSIVWQRRTVAPETAETVVLDDTNTGGSVITCTEAPTSDTYSLTANYDRDNGEQLYVVARSAAAVAVETYADLEVRVEVKVDNIEMYVSDNPNDPGSQAVSSVNLIDGTKYYVDCVIRQATPAPSSIDVKLDVVSLTDEGGSTFGDVASGQRTNLRTGKKFSFTPDYSTDCNMMLTCISGNAANDLITGSPSTTVEKSLSVIVSRGPAAPTLIVDNNADEDGLPNNEMALFMQRESYQFKCTTGGVADPEPEIQIIINDKDGVELDNEILSLGEDTADCTPSSPKSVTEHYQIFNDLTTIAQCASITCRVNNIAGTMDATITKIELIVPPYDVTLKLLELGSGAAALETASSTDLSIDTVLSGMPGEKLILINGESYALEAVTDRLTPLATFVWQLQMTDGTPISEVDRKVAANSNIDCTIGTDSDTWDLNQVVYDTYDGKLIYVEAGNIHTDSAVSTTVELDVFAEVKQQHMRMYLSDDAGTPEALDVDTPETKTLIQGVTYYVDCQVLQANPIPTVTVSVDGDVVGGQSVSPQFTDDNSNAQLALLTYTRRVSFVANFAIHCGRELICSASNTANELRNNHNGANNLPQPQISVNLIVLINQVNSPVLSLNELGANNDDQDDNPSDDKAILIEGLTYEFDCTIAATANIRWTLKNSNDDEIDTETDPSGVSASGCDATSFTGKYTLTQASVAYHCGYLECTAYNDQDTDGKTVKITFKVIKSPDSIAMYKGDIPNTSTPVLGDPAGDTNEVAEGDTVTFSCLASGANPSAAITWSLAGTNLNDDEFIQQDPSDTFYDTYSTLTTSSLSYSNCGMILSCTTDHPESLNNRVFTAQTTLVVGARPRVVGLELLQSGSGPAATSDEPYIDLQTDTIVNQIVLRVIHGRTYLLLATTNAIDPGAKFDWFRTSDLNTPGSGTPLRTGNLPSQQITCTAKEDTDMLTIANIDYDEWKDRELRVDASNSNSIATGSVWQHVNLDVDVEVLDSNMEMYASSDSDPSSKGTALNLNNDLTLEDGKTYYVYCDVKQATPNIDITLDWTGTFSGINTVVTSGLLSELRSSRRFSFTVKINEHDGQTLTCVASNDANKLLNKFQPQSNPISQSISVDVRVSSGPITGQCNPTCRNGGTCEVSNACSCPNGFTGFFCESATGGNCNSGCQNGGTCEISNTCTCPSGFTGTFCQTPVDCNPSCQNGGTCNGVSNTCRCITGWTGPRCEIADACNPNCINGGTCTASGTCACVVGFSGQFCQIGSPIGGGITRGIITASITILSIDNVEVECTPQILDPSTQEFQDLVDILKPKLVGIFCVPIPGCTDLIITAFTCGSVISDFNLMFATNTQASVDDITNIINTAVGDQDGNAVNIGSGVVITPSETQVTATCFQDCSNGGTCIGPNTCMCTAGYTGSQCQTKSGLSTTSIIGIAAGGAGFLIILGLVLLCLYFIARPRRERFPVTRNPYSGEYVDQRIDRRPVNEFSVPYVADGTEALRYGRY